MPFYPQNPGTAIEQNGTIIPASTISFANGTISTSGSTISYTAPQIDFVYGTLSTEPTILTIGSGLVLTSSLVTPTVVQSQTVTNSTTISLPSPPTVGNILVSMVADQDTGPGISGFITLVSNNGFTLQTRTVQAGDGQTYAYANYADNGYMFEIANSYSSASGYETLSNSGSGPYNYSFAGTVAVSASSLTLALMGVDQNGASATWSSPLPSGATIAANAGLGFSGRQSSCVLKYIGGSTSNITLGATNSTAPGSQGGCYITFLPNPNVTNATLAT